MIVSYMSLGTVDQVLKNTNILIHVSKIHDFLISVSKEKKMSVSNFLIHLVRLLYFVFILFTR